MNFLLARPEWRFGIQKFWGYEVRDSWDKFILYRNMKLFPPLKYLISNYFKNNGRVDQALIRPALLGVEGAGLNHNVPKTELKKI